ncbi:hypothetical protein GJ496_007716 [Pomphorhynchus laevis]|nr:hypothetical protein GJ496_007716 [Pomphorhynchus laevis]
MHYTNASPNETVYILFINHRHSNESHQSSTRNRQPEKSNSVVVIGLNERLKAYTHGTLTISIDWHITTTAMTLKNHPTQISRYTMLTACNYIWDVFTHRENSRRDNALAINDLAVVIQHFLVLLCVSLIHLKLFWHKAAFHSSE